VAIVSYPLALLLFHVAGRAAVSAATPAMAAAAWTATSLCLAIALAPPTLGWVVARRASPPWPLDPSYLFQRRVAHLGFAAVPLWTATGVVLSLLDLGQWDFLVWVVAWTTIGWRLAKAAPADAPVPAMPAGTPPTWLRVAHGVGAAALILLILAGTLGLRLT
jgi:hypothetical protein